MSAFLTPHIRRAGKDKKQFRVILKGGNGEPVFISEMYTRKQKAKAAIKLLQQIDFTGVKDLTLKKKIK